MQAVNHADAGSGLASTTESSVEANLSCISAYLSARAVCSAGDGQPAAEIWACSLEGSGYPCTIRPSGA